MAIRARFSPPAFVLALLLAAAAPAQQAAPDVLLARIRSQMAVNLQNLPNYVCLETIERSRRPVRSLMLVPTDRLKLEVAHVGQRELYAWPGEKELGALDVTTLAGGGLIGNGAFSLRARTLFLTKDATFRYVGRERSKGRELVRWDFWIAADTKRFLLAYGDANGFVGERGSFWADAESLDIVRMRSDAADIPPDIGISSSHSEVEYQRSRIADSEFLLPARAEVRLSTRDGAESRNLTTFSACRRYGVESTLSFDFDASTADSQSLSAQEPPAAPFDLPVDLELSIELRTPIDTQKSMEGDPLEGRLTADVMQDGKLVAPAGALVRGRLRRLERLPEYGNAILVSLDFHSLEFGGQTGRFLAEMQSFQHTAGVSDSLEPVGRGQTGKLHAPAVVGVGSMFLTGRDRISAGFSMAWRTEEVPPPSAPKPGPREKP
jgi:hypothetical protein